MRVQPSLLLALGLALVVGFAGGGATAGFGLFRDRAQAVEAPGVRLAPPEEAAEPEELERPTLEGADDVLDREIDRLRRERDALARQVEAQAEELAALRTATASHRRGPTFTFGAGGALEGVRQADWVGMAQASQAVLEGLKRILAAADAGEAVPKEAALQVQQNVERIRVYEYGTLDRLATAAKHNGELTHPITVTNLFAALLEDAGVPLTADQTDRFRALGLRLEDDLEAVLEGPGPRVRRLVGEYRLKQTFMAQIREALTEAQRAVVVDPETQGIAGLDLYDPSLILIHTSPVLAADTEAGVVAKLEDLLAKKWQLEAEERSRLEPLLEAWRARIRPLLAPTSPVRLKHYTAAVAGEAGDATVALVDGALRDLDLRPEVRTALEEDPSIYVPRLIAP